MRTHTSLLHRGAAGALGAICLAGVFGFARPAPAQETVDDPKAEIERLQIIVEVKQQRIEQLERELARYRQGEKAESNRRTVAELVRTMERLRGLRAKQPVEMTPLTPAVLQDLIDREFRKQYTDEQFQGWRNTLVHLGMIPAEMDLRAFLYELYEEQVGGLYDDETKKLYVSDKLDLGNSIGRIVLAHEITHALQDQHFNLTSSPVRLKSNDDRVLAAMSVVEGDATLAMSEYLAENMSWRILLDIPGMLALDQEKLAEAPRFISQSLLFPYMQGMTFITEAMKAMVSDVLDSERISDLDGDADQMLNRLRNRLLKDFPESSEQILHPRKYLERRRDRPTEIALDAVTSAGLIPAANRIDNVAGEFGVKILLEGQLSGRQAARAAAGWDGDRIAFGGDPNGDYAMAWLSLWDTAEDAREAAEALAVYFRAQRPGLEKKAVEAGEADWYADARGHVAIAVQGRSVAVAHAAAQERARQILDALRAVEVEPVP